jgi:signal transduction histidine kinase
VLVDLIWRDGGVSVRVDNAVSGAASNQDALGHGLPGMRERAALVGGFLTADQTPGNRFVVTVFVPVAATAQQGSIR